jgi:hypothetical protein
MTGAVGSINPRGLILHILQMAALSVCKCYQRHCVPLIH